MFNDILITGSNGFLGKVIASVLKNNHNLFYLSRFSGNYKVFLDKEIPHFNQKFNLIIHAAGKAHNSPKNEVEEREFYNINIVGTNNLLKGLEKSGIPDRFVFISSVAVYGLEKGKQINEGYNLSAKDPYGLSKIKAEHLVLEWCQKNNVICTILRLPLLVGKNPPGNLGAMVNGIKKGYYFNIGGGTAKKSMVLAMDVAQFIPDIAAVGGIYNLTDGEHPTFESLSFVIAKKEIRNLPLIVVKTMGFLGDIIGDKAPINSLKIKKITSDLTFDDSKAREFGWKPQSVIEYLKRNDLN